MAAPRRVTTAVVALVLFASPAIAGWPAYIETHVGASSSRLHGDVAYNTHAERLALSVAGLWPLGHGLMLDLEAGYAGRGADFGQVPWYDGTGTYALTADERYDLDYLQLPMLLRYSAGKGHVRPTLVGGVDLFYKTGERWRMNDNRVFLEPGATTMAHNFDWSPTVGGGVEADGPGGTWTLEGRYDWGMTNIATTSSSPGKVHVRDFQLLFGVREPWPWGK